MDKDRYKKLVELVPDNAQIKEYFDVFFRAENEDHRVIIEQAENLSLKLSMEEYYDRGSHSFWTTMDYYRPRFEVTLSEIDQLKLQVLLRSLRGYSNLQSFSLMVKYYHDHMKKSLNVKEKELDKELKEILDKKSEHNKFCSDLEHSLLSLIGLEL
jgi:hypothetical protein